MPSTLFCFIDLGVLFQALSSATYPYYAAAAAAAAAAAGVAGVGGVGGVGGAGQLGYWYPPQSYPTTATQMQAGGFLQGMQGYTYGQFAGYQQAQYMGWERYFRTTISNELLPSEIYFSFFFLFYLKSKSNDICRYERDELRRSNASRRRGLTVVFCFGKLRRLVD